MTSKTQVTMDPDGMIHVGYVVLTYSQAVAVTNFIDSNEIKKEIIDAIAERYQIENDDVIASVDDKILNDMRNTVEDCIVNDDEISEDIWNTLDTYKEHLDEALRTD